MLMPPGTSGKPSWRLRTGSSVGQSAS
jgi:hypothetical protein